jgi:hypothetical protein
MLVVYDNNGNVFATHEDNHEEIVDKYPATFSIYKIPNEKISFADGIITVDNSATKTDLRKAGTKEQQLQKLVQASSVFLKEVGKYKMQQEATIKTLVKSISQIITKK